MQWWQSFSRRVRPGLFLALLVTLASVYLVTYSAFFQSQDTTRIFDAANSLARFGDLGRDETFWREPPERFEYLPDYPITSYELTEPLMPIVVSIWYRLVYVLPGIGLVHGTWLFNIFVVAMICGLFFQYAQLISYRDAVALIGSILLGLGTALWIYSKTLFREPLVALFLLVIALLITGWHKVGYVRRAVSGILIFLAFVMAVLTKNSAIMALPAVMVFMLPDSLFNRRWLRWTSDGLLIAVLLLVFSMAVVPAIFQLISNILVQFSSRFQSGLASGQEALFTYLFGIGGSVWGTSPALLLALPGGVLLVRGGQRRLVWFIVLLVVGYAIGHAYSSGPHWFGGVSWPPRFLIPVIPIVMMGVLPVLDWLTQPGRHILWRIAAGILTIYSFSVQVIGAISRLLSYNGLLPPQANGLHEWSGGLNDIRYLRWVLLPQSWSSVGLDVAWARIDTPIIAGVYIAVAIVSLSLLWHWQRPRVRWILLVLVGVLIINTGVGLRLLYLRDREYDATKQPLFDMLQILETEAEAGQPLLLEGDFDSSHEDFLLNYNRVPTVRPIIIGFSPGENASEQDSGCVRDTAVYEREIACISSDYPPEMVELYAPHAIDFLAERHDRIWFLAHNSAFLPWSVRPTEQYLSAKYYPLGEVQTPDPTVRLLEFSTIAAPNRYDVRLPEVRTNLVYDDAIHLSGFTLPMGTTYTPGDVVPITLWWQTSRQLEADYVVAWFIVKDDATLPPIQGMDSMPDVGFAPTSQWQPNIPVWDNRAIELPPNMPSGIYRIWVLLYPPESGGTVRLPVRGSETIDGEIGVLPIELIISPEN